MFDYILIWTATRYSGHPELNDEIQGDNDLINELATEALKEISLKSHQEWRQICELQERIRDLEDLLENKVND